MHRILLIDDDEHLAPPLTTYLKRYDFEVIHADRPSVGLARLAAEPFDAVILDVMLPEMDGFEVLREIRRQHSTPVLMLTARGELTDRVVGLEMGADDYLPKPFEPRELAARLTTVLRRVKVAAAPNPGEAEVLRFEGLQIDVPRREVTRQGEVLALTGTEYELLLLLAKEPRKVFSRDDILSRLRGHDADLYTRAVDILVSRLRKKLEPLDCIKTLRNAGYAFAAGSAR
ncbi:response regulator transcription factor [Ideonella sp.]|jgi:two-component system OmpR family response regulator|uniref:response regulator transcription factor n=1 Tax=Ideonella sp. TaxID=1929293 RepID=UPI0037BE2A11